MEKSFFRNHTVSGIIVILGAVLLILIVFQIGVSIGYHRGLYADSWSAAFNRDFNDPSSILAPFLHGDPVNPHGATGLIVSVHLPEILIKDSGNIEQVIRIGTSTSIRVLRHEAAPTDLKIGEKVIVIGAPDEKGAIDAVLIRMVPPFPPLSTSTLQI